MPSADWHTEHQEYYVHFMSMFIFILFLSLSLYRIANVDYKNWILLVESRGLLVYSIIVTQYPQ